uniref:Uncharacterized protein n=1 Tax=Mustela putorius furo TaxID=9669 RepID=M3YTD6_MUSPF
MSSQELPSRAVTSGRSPALPPPPSPGWCHLSRCHGPPSEGRSVVSLMRLTLSPRGAEELVFLPSTLNRSGRYGTHGHGLLECQTS